MNTKQRIKYLEESIKLRQRAIGELAHLAQDQFPAITELVKHFAGFIPSMERRLKELKEGGLNENH